MKRENFTLIEVLFTISIIGMFICVAIPFFTNSAKTTKRLASDAFSLSDISILKNEFRGFVHSFDPDSFSISSDGQSICSPDGRAVILKDASIVFREPSGRKKEMGLEKNLKASLAVEKLPTGATAAVLTLKFTPESEGSARKTEYKIVAAPPFESHVNTLLENAIPN